MFRYVNQLNEIECPSFSFTPFTNPVCAFSTSWTCMSRSYVYTYVIHASIICWLYMAISASRSCIYFRLSRNWVSSLNLAHIIAYCLNLLVWNTFSLFWGFRLGFPVVINLSWTFLGRHCCIPDSIVFTPSYNLVSTNTHSLIFFNPSDDCLIFTS